MPAKGEPLSEEQKARMAAGRERAAAQRKTEADHNEAVAVFREEAEETAKGGAAVQQMPVTEAVGEAVEEYGPYDDYKVVPTPYGDLGVSFRTVGFFLPVEEFDSKAGRIMTKYRNFARPATPEEMAPILARVQKKRLARQAAHSGV